MIIEVLVAVDDPSLPVIVLHTSDLHDGMETLSTDGRILLLL